VANRELVISSGLTLVSPAPSEQIRVWQRYLSPEALKLIGENPESAQFGELLLIIPPD
jgi:hypothetical protein